MVSIGDAPIKIFNRTLKMAIDFSQNPEPSIVELAHYIVDNLIGKICMEFMKTHDSDSIWKNPSTKKKTKDFPALLKGLYNIEPQITVDKKKIMEQHNKRNYFQHGHDSIEVHLDKAYTDEYIQLASQIMKDLGIYLPNDTNFFPLIKKITEPVLMESQKEILSVIKDKFEENILKIISEPKIEIQNYPFFILQIIPFRFKEIKIKHKFNLSDTDFNTKWKLKFPNLSMPELPKDVKHGLNHTTILYGDYKNPSIFITLLNNGILLFGGLIGLSVRYGSKDIRIGELKGYIGKF